MTRIEKIGIEYTGEVRLFEYSDFEEAWSDAEAWMRSARYFAYQVVGEGDQRRILIEIDEESVKEAESLAL